MCWSRLLSSPTIWVKALASRPAVSLGICCTIQMVNSFFSMLILHGIRPYLGQENHPACHTGISALLTSTSAPNERTSHRHAPPLRRRALWRLAWALFAMCLSTLHGNAQIRYGPGWQTPTDWSAWLNEDVRAILTESERATFLGLQDDADRRKFVQRLWQNNDPEQHYKRLEYANRVFGTTVLRGAQTDRGIVYVKFGPPDTVDSYPDGTDSRRLPTEGWFYVHLNGTAGIYITFMDQFRTGDYRISGGQYARHQILGMDPHIGMCCGAQPRPVRETPNEFSTGVSATKDCRCEGIVRRADDPSAISPRPYLEIYYSPITRAAVRMIIFASNRGSWFGRRKGADANDQALDFRGQVSLPTGRVVIAFDDIWRSTSLPDATWPLNRCERMLLSPGTYRLDFVAVDVSTNSQVAHCSQEFVVPRPDGDNRPVPSLVSVTAP